MRASGRRSTAGGGRRERARGGGGGSRRREPSEARDARRPGELQLDPVAKDRARPAVAPDEPPMSLVSCRRESKYFAGLPCLFGFVALWKNLAGTSQIFVVENYQYVGRKNIYSIRRRDARLWRK